LAKVAFTATGAAACMVKDAIELGGKTGMMVHGRGAPWTWVTCHWKWHFGKATGACFACSTHEQALTCLAAAALLTERGSASLRGGARGDQRHTHALLLDGKHALLVAAFGRLHVAVLL
jgi:hypothetical protein